MYPPMVPQAAVAASLVLTRPSPDVTIGILRSEANWVRGHGRAADANKRCVGLDAMVNVGQVVM